MQMILEQEIATKICTRCGLEKSLSAFSRDCRAKDGKCSKCKICNAEYVRSPAGKISREKYRQSDKGKITSKQADAKSYSIIWGYLGHVYKDMKRRCENPNCSGYKNYGGRGIRVCFESLDDFRNYVINDLKIDPRRLTIDRIDNDGHYECGNIRFVTNLVNQQNKRKRHG